MDVADLLPIPVEAGYAGLFMVSFFGSLVPFVPIPSFVLLATMSASGQFDLHLMAVPSALLAAGAKLAIFYTGYGGRRIVGRAARARMRPFERLVGRYGGAAAFVAAATPVPDDMVYLPLGLSRYSPARFLAATVAGKLVLHYAVAGASAYVGAPVIEGALEATGDPLVVWAGIAAFAGALAAATALTLRLDWARVLGRVAPWTLDDGDGRGRP